VIKNIERTKDQMDSIIDRTRDSVIGAADRAERGVEAAAERAVKTAHVAGQSVRVGARNASDRAHRQLESAAEALDRGYVRARTDLSRAATAATDYVVENPAKAVLLAASAGFVLGLLARRRRLPA